MITIFFSINFFFKKKSINIKKTVEIKRVEKDVSKYLPEGLSFFLSLLFTLISKSVNFFFLSPTMYVWYWILCKYLIFKYFSLSIVDGYQLTLMLAKKFVFNDVFCWNLMSVLMREIKYVEPFYLPWLDSMKTACDTCL